MTLLLDGRLDLGGMTPHPGSRVGRVPVSRVPISSDGFQMSLGKGKSILLNPCTVSFPATMATLFLSL
jgi:hypothetical protein